MLLDGERVVGAAFDGRVVGDDHAPDAADRPDAADEPGGRQRRIVDPVPGELADLEPRSVRVEELRHARARGQLTTFEVARARFLGAAGLDLG